ncbi:MAG: hypothetical protein ICV64_12510 [Thermoleophilia bacterium]|nr:hypothetical protein [Thermoleophilia bacterium]
MNTLGASAVSHDPVAAVVVHGPMAAAAGPPVTVSFTARAAGARAILVRDGTTRPEDVERAPAVAPTLDRAVDLGPAGALP